MSKSKNKELKALYLQKEREKYLEKLANSNDPVEKALFLEYTPAKKEITSDYILTTPYEELHIELLKKIHEEVEMIRKLHWKQESEAQLMLHAYKRMLLFTSMFESLACVGDADKFLHGTAHSKIEIAEAIDGYRLINQTELVNLLVAARDNRRFMYKIEQFFEEDKGIEKINQERMKFIRRHTNEFVY
jgi:hypothetical protein